MTQLKDQEALSAELERLQPAELLYPDDFLNLGLIDRYKGLRRRPNWEFERDTALRLLNQQFGTKELEGFGVDSQALGLGAAGCLLQYVKDTQKTALPHIQSITQQSPDTMVVMDAATRKNLELTFNLSGGIENTLAAVLDKTSTPMGSRLLKRWLHQPLRDQQAVSKRQDIISAILEQGLNPDFSELLKQIGDIERVLARLALRSARPRDMARLRTAFAVLPHLHNLLQHLPAEIGQPVIARCGEFPELLDLLERAIVENPPVLIRDGGVIAPGYHEELDEWRALSQGATDYLLKIEEREKERTGISTLKVGFNKVHGYYIEVSRAYSERVPIEYVRRQTLKNNERFIIPELKEYEEKVLGSQSKALALEKRLYDELFESLLPHLNALQVSAQALCELDVLNNLAERAESLNYCRPVLTAENQISITAGRHPVVEQVSDSPFIANPLALDDSRRMLVITGPNMGGKSTYMRQTALIVLMAYMGSFVPADAANIGPIDRIFTRIGASDDLASGRSTFMVEMTETANILHNASANSLVLMDEIGRGTSTYDGLSLAWASAESLARQVRAYTLFATHYFELTQLASQMSGLANVHLDAVEHEDTIAFMHAVQEGAASKSFGLQVAQLAGVPKAVIQRAKQKLHQLEAQGENPAAAAPLPEPQLPLQLDSHPVLDALSSIDVDDLSPREAQALLYDLKAKL